MEQSAEHRLAALLGGSLEGKVKEKADSFGGLLTRGAAVQLLCQENGISTERKLLLSEALASLLPFSFSARVERVFPAQQFPGGTMRTVRLHVSDKSGQATIVLWNEQARIAEGGIFAGDTVECSGAYFRAGEIAISRNGAVSRAAGGAELDVAGLREGLCNVRGSVGEAGGMRTYRDRKTGAEKRMLAFTICSGGKCCRAVWWSPPEGAPRLQAGAQVVLEGASFREGEIHLNGFSRVVSQGAPGGKAGGFSGISIEGPDAVVAIGNEKFRMPIHGALALFRLHAVPPGVDAATLLSIKSRSLEGKSARYFSEGGSLASVEFEN
ncbi:MAG: hypothetical protein WC263_01110 [Candidatus Micrarchaeia archaeon]|jgi:hypothetical protein